MLNHASLKTSRHQRPPHLLHIHLRHHYIDGPHHPRRLPSNASSALNTCFQGAFSPICTLTPSTFSRIPCHPDPQLHPRNAERERERTSRPGRSVPDGVLDRTWVIYRSSGPKAGVWSCGPSVLGPQGAVINSKHWPDGVQEVPLRY
jgi:hypothetical protein